MDESDNSPWEKSESDYDHSLEEEYNDTTWNNEETEQSENLEDYEEEQEKTRESYNNSLKNYPIDIDIKIIISKKIKKINIKNLNFTLLVASMVILAKNKNKINSKFTELCDEVIETIIKNDINIEKKEIEINQLKRDILRYCRFVQLCAE